MDWYYRFVHGHRPIEGDIDHFSRTFPDFSSAQDVKFLLGPLVFWRGDEKGHPLQQHLDSWLGQPEESKRMDRNEETAESCPLKNCPKISERKYSVPPVLQRTDEDGGLLEFIAMPKIHKYNDRLAKIAEYIKIDGFDLHEIHWVDPYLFTVFSKGGGECDKATNIISDVKNKFQHAKLTLYSHLTMEDGLDPISKEQCEHLKLPTGTSFKDLNHEWHDRPIILLGKDSETNQHRTEGIIIGTSANSINGKRRYIISRLDQADASEIHSDIKDSKEIARI